jgi:hypothetical protein
VGKLTGRNGTPPPTVNGSSLVRHCGWGGSGIWDWRAFRQDGHHMVDIFLRELSMYCQSVGPFRTRGMGVHAVTHAHARNAALCSGTRTNKQTSRVEPRCARRFLRTCRPAQPSARSHLPGTPTSAPRRAPPARLPRQQRRAPIAAAANVAEAEASHEPACGSRGGSGGYDLGQAPRVVAPWSQS